MTVVVHKTVQTMIGEGFEALAPNGEWIALFSEGNFMTQQSSPLSSSAATDGDTVILDTEAA